MRQGGPSVSGAVMMIRTMLLVPVLTLGAWGCQDARNGTPGKKGDPGAKAPAASARPDPGEAFDSGLPKEHQDKVVARVGDMTITLKEFERRLKQQAPYAQIRFNSPERKREFLDNIVRFEVLAAEAAKAGYDRDPDVVQQMKQTMVRKLMAKEVQGLVKLSDITDAEMKKYYDDHSDTYHKPEQVRVSQILIKDAAKAKKTHAEVVRKTNADRRNYRKVFADMAREHTEDGATKPRGGDLRFFARTEEGGGQTKAVSDAAFALAKIGDISLPFQSEQGWHVLLLTGRKNRYDRAFDQVKRQIQNRLYREKKKQATDKYVADLKAKARVESKAELLDLVKVGGAKPRGAVSPLGPVDPTGAPARVPIPAKPASPRPPVGPASAPAPAPATTP